MSYDSAPTFIQLSANGVELLKDLRILMSRAWLQFQRSHSETSFWNRIPSWFVYIVAIDHNQPLKKLPKSIIYLYIFCGNIPTLAFFEGAIATNIAIQGFPTSGRPPRTLGPAQIQWRVCYRSIHLLPPWEGGTNTSGVGETSWWKKWEKLWTEQKNTSIHIYIYIYWYICNYVHIVFLFCCLYPRRVKSNFEKVTMSQWWTIAMVGREPVGFVSKRTLHGTMTFMRKTWCFKHVHCTRWGRRSYYFDPMIIFTHRFW